MIIDIDKPEEVIAAPMSEHSHSEPITKVCYMARIGSVIREIYNKKKAPVVQWYDARLPRVRPGFDSRLAQIFFFFFFLAMAETPRKILKF